MHRCRTMKWNVSWSSHQRKSADYKQGTVFGAEYWLQCVGNYGGNIGIYFRWVSQMLTQEKKEDYANLSGPAEQTQGWRGQFPGLYLYQWRNFVSPLWARVKMAVHGVAIYDFPMEEKGVQTIITPSFTITWASKSRQQAEVLIRAAWPGREAT